MCASIPNPVRTGDGDAHQVRLHRTGDQHRIRTARQRHAKVELKLAHLVAAQGEPGAVFALDPPIDDERRAHVQRGVERRQRVADDRRLSPRPFKIENRIVYFQ